MDLLQGNTKTACFRYLDATFNSTLISTVYSTVDMAVVRQYWGPEDTVTLAVVTPVWNITYSLRLLTGIDGSVLFGATGGKGEGHTGGEHFTTVLMITVALTAASWLMVLFFDTPILRLFGVEEALLPLAREYFYPIKFVVPLFLFNQMLAAFLRNDGNSGLAAATVLPGGVFNIIGDYLSVFVFGMGVMGAGLVTAVGASITFAGMISHFFARKDTMRLARPSLFWGRYRRIIVTGFSIFLIDMTMKIPTMLFNRQVVKYLGSSALSIYDIIVNVSTIVQCRAYSTGQTSQPIFSICFGAGKWDRVKETLKYVLYPVACFSVVWTLLIFTFPNEFTRIFMAPTGEIYRIAPFTSRSYRISFLLPPLNVFSTYYSQALMKPGVSFLVSVLEGLILSGIMICLLPIVADPDSLWFVMVITEAAVAVLIISLIRRYTREPPVGQAEPEPGRP